MKHTLTNCNYKTSLRFLRSAKNARSLSLRGFTLIEMLVAVALFVIVMLVAIGALVSVASADRKAQSIQTVVDNLNFALDDMSRTMVTGTTYHCSPENNGVVLYNTPQADPSLTLPQNCSSIGSTYLSLSDQTGREVVYWFNAACNSNNGCIEVSTNGGSTYLPLTSAQLSITDGRFYVIGACGPTLSDRPCADGTFDTNQPKVTLRFSASIPTGTGGATTLHVETSVTQRVYDTN